jgi:hypothetical protein
MLGIDEVSILLKHTPKIHYSWQQQSSRPTTHVSHCCIRYQKPDESPVHGCAIIATIDWGFSYSENKMWRKLGPPPPVPWLCPYLCES